MVFRPEVCDEFGRNIRYFNTFAGSSIPVAAGAAVLDVFEQENVQQRVLENGTALRAGLQEITQASPYVAEVRGSGLYVGVEIVEDRETREPDRARAEDVITDMRDRRVLISGTGKAANVLKIRPPLAFDLRRCDPIPGDLRRGRESPAVAGRPKGPTVSTPQVRHLAQLLLEESAWRPPTSPSTWRW